jgi:mRNA interferase MazF
MKIEKFHIYLADLNPRFGAEPGKVHPVVSIQTDLLNGIHPSTIICPITTRVIKKSSILRVHLSRKGAGLKQDSDILVDQIRAIDNKRFIKHIGEINNTQKQSLQQNLNVLILE